jgi:hypothetical protein
LTVAEVGCKVIAIFSLSRCIAVFLGSRPSVCEGSCAILQMSVAKWQPAINGVMFTHPITSPVAETQAPGAQIGDLISPCEDQTLMTNSGNALLSCLES